MLAAHVAVDVVSPLGDVAAVGTGEPWFLEAHELQMLREIVVTIVHARAVRTGEGLVAVGLVTGAGLWRFRR